jgi:hypothetical protein
MGQDGGVHSGEAKPNARKGKGNQQF